jgi:hypothetical protein
MIALITLGIGFGLGFAAHKEYTRRMWKLARRFRRAAMGGRSRR